ncbi:MAG: hypothetical protein Q9163_004161 [Psora crenata]
MGEHGQSIQLESQLQKLGVSTPIPDYGNARFLVNPIDIFRCYLTEIVDGLLQDFPAHPLFSRPVASGIHLQIFFAPEVLPQILLPYLLDQASSYGHDDTLGYHNTKDQVAGRKKVIVEFSSPNIAKEFHAGHLRSTIIGAYIANLYKSMGWDVVKMNYLGDWGKQFGLVAVGWKKFGSEDLIERDPLGHLLDVYIRINKLFQVEKAAIKAAKDRKEDTSQLESQGIHGERNAFFSRLEAREPEALALWKRFREISIQRYIGVYARLNIAFDIYSGESQVDPKTIDRVQSILTEKGVLQEDNNALIIDFKRYGSKGLDIAIVRNRQGTTTYLLRDVAAVIERAEKYHFDKMIYVVSSEQDVYLKRVFKTVELMGFVDLAKKLEHVNFGKVEGMSSRLGQVELLSGILDRCGDAMHSVMKKNEVKYQQVDDPQKISDTLGITAVMVQDMSGKRIHNYPFDIDRMMQPIGDTGPYLQFSHARLSSILRKCGYTRGDLVAADFSLLKEQHIIDTLRLLAQYPDVTHNAFQTLEPTTILTYLFKLNHMISSGYEVVRVIDIPEGPDVSRARAAYYECARQVLDNGLRLLGITPVER